MPLTISDCDVEIKRLWKLQKTAGEFERDTIMAKIDMYLESRYKIKMRHVEESFERIVEHV